MSPRNPFVGLAIAQPAPDPAMPVSATVSPDAALIAACNEYHRIQRAFEAYCATLNDDLEDEDEEYARTVLDPLKDLEETIVSLRGTTAEGHLARARCWAFYHLPHHSACQDDPGDASEDRFKAAALRDLVHAERGAADGGTVTAHPDAELLAACAAFAQAQADFNVTNATRGLADGAINALSERWDMALSAVLASSSPTTQGGRIALARAARIALLAVVGDLGPGGYEENTTPEHRLIVKALEGLIG